MEAYVLMVKVVLVMAACFVGAGLLFFVVSCVIERTAQEGYQIPGVGFVTKEQFEAAMKKPAAMKEANDGQK